MTAAALLKLIPARCLSALALQTQVDHQVKKLSGEVMFKLILFSMLNSEKLSLRVMESFLASASFKSFAHSETLHSKYNSIRDRICTMQATYFERLFNRVFTLYNRCLRERQALASADSTFVALSAKLLAQGMQNGPDSRRHLKYSVVLKGSLPASVKVFTEAAFVCEDRALSRLIEDSAVLQDGIVVFDRGVQSRAAFDHFTECRKWFIARSKTNIYFQRQHARRLPRTLPTASVKVYSDEEGFLYKRHNKLTQHPYRVIKASLKKNGEALWLITNLMDEDPYTLAEWYRRRWDIEVFFKFIKQHLSAAHLVSRTENGIKVMIYMTMIVAVLIIAYKKLNGIDSYKIAKLQFEIELENQIIKTIVTLCGGDPRKAAPLWNSS